MPTIFTLPPELRQQIYSHLLPAHPTSHPLPSVGLTSVSHRPPASALLNIHPTLTDEILAYFYSIATWKIIFSHAFNFFRVDPDLKGLERSAALGRLRKVEVVFFCDVLLLKDWDGGTGGLGIFCEEVRRRAERACDVLLQAERLREVTVSWIDTTGPAISTFSSSDNDSGIDGWAPKSSIFEPLRKLRRLPVAFKIGEVNGPDREWFVRQMQLVLGEDLLGQRVEEDKDAQKPAKLRLLAFDVRQDRHLLQRKREEALLCGS